jgi:uncharacterized protein (DUF2141 family)
MILRPVIALYPLAVRGWSANNLLIMPPKASHFLPLLLGLLSLSSGRYVAAYRTLPIEIANISEATGTIWIGVYRSEQDFLSRQHARILRVPVQRSQALRTHIDQLETGQYYAIALFHDRNDNGELDRNFLGLPAEPFAFSGELQSRWRLPRFNEVRFRFTPRGTPMRFYLRNW